MPFGFYIHARLKSTVQGDLNRPYVGVFFFSLFALLFPSFTVKAQAPIIVYENAPPRTIACAQELADYIQKIGGTAPELMVGSPASIPESAIWIGYQPALDKLLPNTEFTFQHPEEILLKSNGQHLVIAGRDRWIQEGMTRPGRKKTVEDIQQEYGTCNAIFTFLQKYLDIRWLGPGEAWEDIPLPIGGENTMKRIRTISPSCPMVNANRPMIPGKLSYA